MQLARLGGMSGLPIILPGKIDGYVQAIRGKNVAFEPQTDGSNSSFANAGNDKLSMAVEICVDSDEKEVDVGEMNHAGFSDDELKSTSKPNASGEACTTVETSNKFPPLKSCLPEVIEFPDVLGQVPDDFQLFDCKEAEEPLRILSNPTDGWVYPVMSTSYPARTPYVLSEFEYEVENFWNALQISVPHRLIPFARHNMTRKANFDFRSSFLEAFEILVEFGSIRDRNDARGV